MSGTDVKTFILMFRTCGATKLVEKNMQLRFQEREACVNADMGVMRAQLSKEKALRVFLL